MSVNPIPTNQSLTRRVIAIGFAACGAGVMSYLALKGNAEAFAALVATVSTIIGFYFGAKSVQV